MPFNKPLIRLMLKDSSDKMPQEVDMTSMFMFIEEQEHIFVEKKPLF